MNEKMKELPMGYCDHCEEELECFQCLQCINYCECRKDNV